MPPEYDFRDLVTRVRAGDQEASTEFAQDVRAVHLARCPIRDAPTLERPEAACAARIVRCLPVGLQEPLRGSQARAIRAEKPEQLQKLLRIMSRFKIATEGRRLSVILREVMEGDTPPDQVDSGPGPEKSIEDQDLAEAVLSRFADDELELLQRRLDGETWPEIAELAWCRCGHTAQTTGTGD